jgi:phenylpropionate dioxygenase-like ring-hydroxylating dioxygenase large terminal subunit
VEGRLPDSPNYPNPAYQAKFRARTYPCQEAGGLIWGYFGPAEVMPALPDFAFMDAAATHRNIERIDLNCNYLQLLEVGMDSSHVGILHSDVARPGWQTNSVTRNADVLNPGALAVDDNAPTLSIETTEFGFHYAAIRRGKNGVERARIVLADAAIVQLRRLLLTTVRDLAAGKEPPQLPNMKKIAGVAGTDLAPGGRWQDLVPHHYARRNAALVELAD